MTECYCADCADKPHKMYTEQHRHNTECRYIAKLFWNDLKGFERFMVGVEKERGTAGALKLRNGVNYLWSKVK